jgi:hypothetical protein
MRIQPIDRVDLVMPVPATSLRGSRHRIPCEQALTAKHLMQVSNASSKTVRWIEETYQESMRDGLVNLFEHIYLQVR